MLKKSRSTTPLLLHSVETVIDVHLKIPIFPLSRLMRSAKISAVFLNMYIPYPKSYVETAFNIQIFKLKIPENIMVLKYQTVITPSIF